MADEDFLPRINLGRYSSSHISRNYFHAEDECAKAGGRSGRQSVEGNRKGGMSVKYLPHVLQRQRCHFVVATATVAANSTYVSSVGDGK